MENYYVNRQAQSNGDHEVHKGTCSYLPSVENRLYLGQFSSCTSAVSEAKKHYSKADGCYHCSPRCHTR
ncbi:hypothetical protein EZ437_17095 [Pedobacter psychroterrae]|uniref:Uncharacterized protein n=1 Tax=Pedobacter psychroterrae TaxID=2530453 RepID=A0A4R0NHK9_9SPHI|nr:hypothetical protein EZ437_17095 [Pedobacter psychroterrae]